jgi:hypothetical protein
MTLIQQAREIADLYASEHCSQIGTFRVDAVDLVDDVASITVTAQLIAHAPPYVWVTFKLGD